MKINEVNSLRLVYDGQFHCGGSLVTQDYVLTVTIVIINYAIQDRRFKVHFSHLIGGPLCSKA